MKYGIIAGNSSINSTIYRCFDFIREEDAARFAKKFKSLPAADQSDERLHTFRELIIGAYLGSLGHALAHERRISGKTPDWSIVDRDAVTAILEVVNVNAGKGRNVDRLYEAAQDKFIKYKQIAEELSVPYLVGVYGDFFADFEPGEMEEALYGPESGLFHAHATVSGVLFFVDNWFKYWITYYPSPSATRPLSIQSGSFR